MAGIAAAQTVTDTFDVTITIADECQITSTQTLDFGSVGVLTANVDAAATLEVTCTPSTAYDIGLDAGQGTGATTTARLMTSVATDTVEYHMYQDASRSVNWGNTILTDTQASTGTGSTQSFTVYGRVPVQTTPPTGTYTDTVTVTVTY
ncbi:MAG: spore coat U domain-containing protein [Pseudorhodobacter sp.]|nr:spore coat U domain-containing protein [Pseudorhodobacter sp.]